MLPVIHIKNKYSAEATLLMLLTRSYFKKAEGNEPQQFIAANSIDWSLFYQLVRAHGIRPFVYNLLVSYSLPVDEKVLQRLRIESLDMAKSNFERLNELVRMQCLLAKNGIEAVCYKGVLLSERLFGDFITRETCDIDFLVRAADFSKIREVFLSDGYASDYYYTPEYEDVMLRTGCEYMFYKQIGSTLIKIELHWVVINPMQDVPVKNEYFFENSVTEQMSGEHIKRLNIESELLAMLIHHGVNDIWRSLKHVLDLSALLYRYSETINPAQVFDTFANYKIARAAAAGFTLSSELFGVTLPQQKPVEQKAVDRMIEKLLRFPLLPKHKLYLANFRQQLMLRDNFTDKVVLCFKYLGAAVRPNIRDIEQAHLSRNWFFLYYLIKPFRILKMR